LVKLFCVMLSSNLTIQVSEGWDVKKKSWIAMALKLYKHPVDSRLCQIYNSALILQTRMESLECLQLGRALEEFVVQFARVAGVDL
jgi:hypothetical protein